MYGYLLLFDPSSQRLASKAGQVRILPYIGIKSTKNQGRKIFYLTFLSVRKERKEACSAK
jgi:hypothetical protein